MRQRGNSRLGLRVAKPRQQRMAARSRASRKDRASCRERVGWPVDLETRDHALDAVVFVVDMTVFVIAI